MTEFTNLIMELHDMTEAEIMNEFDTTFTVTGIGGERYHVAKWLVEDVMYDDVEYMSQEFFEELHGLLSAYEADEDYFGEEVDSFLFTGEVL